MEIKKISENIYKIPKQGKMNVPVVIYASEKLIKKIKEDKTIQQAMNMAQLPGVVKNIVVCPDAHEGYGACIGGVSAMDLKKGVVSPGEIGYDINCSVRLLKTNLTEKDLEKKGKEKILHSLFKKIPSGVGVGGIKISNSELDKILKEGAQEIVSQGQGQKEDYIYTEDTGKIEGAEPRNVSQRAKARGISQLGSLGAGNHFLEIGVVEEIFDKNVAKTFGLEKEMITIMIHCGSRGLGHQVASDYIKEFEKKYGIENLPDRELVNAPINSELGKKYLSAMACAANFAFANKQLITHWIREDLKKSFSNFNAEVIYDVCHNIAKFEKHKIDGKEKEVLVMRKGATRSFGPGRKELPKKYQKTGQPIFIPGSMGTASYVLVGTTKAEEISFGSTAHGAGRILSRVEASKKLTIKQILDEMKKRGTIVEAGNKKGLVQEAPEAYKDVGEVVKISHEVGIGNLVAKIKPVLVIKG